MKVKSLNPGGDYEGAFKKFEEANQAAGKARDIAESQVEGMKTSLAEAKDALAQAEKYGARSSYPDKFKKAEETLADAQSKLDAKNITDAYPQAKKGKELADELLKLSSESAAEKVYTQAKDYVNTVEAELNKFKANIDKNPKLKDFVEKNDEMRETLNSTQTSMDASKEALVNAKISLDNKAL